MKTRPGEPAGAEVIERLVADLGPVRRLWPPSARLALWLALELGIFAGIVALGLRSDIAQQLRSPLFLLEFAILVLAGAWAAAMALLAAIPGREPGPLATGSMVAMVAAALVLLAVGSPGGPAGAGLACSLRTVLLAAVPWAALLLAARRGASLVPALAGGLAGAAAFLFAAAAMRLVCPADGLAHLLVWHASPALVGLLASTALGGLLFRSWRRG